MDNQRFIEILKSKKCVDMRERDEFMITLAYGQDNELSDIIVSYHNYDYNLECVVEHIFDNIIEDDVNYFFNITSSYDAYKVVETYADFGLIGSVFLAIDEYRYVIVDDAYYDIFTYDSISDVISNYLIDTDFFYNLSDEDFESIIDEINNHDMFYHELE